MQSLPEENKNIVTGVQNTIPGIFFVISFIPLLNYYLTEALQGNANIKKF